MRTGLWTLALIAALLAGAGGIWGILENVGHLGEESTEESLFWVTLAIFLLAVSIMLTLLSQRRR